MSSLTRERALIAEVARHVEHPIPSDGALDALARFSELVHTWSARMNLTGARDPEGLAEVLFTDAFALAGDALVAEGARVVDVGSGAGAPALPLALLRPDLTLELVEPLRKRVTFLRTALGSLGLAGRVRVHERRLEGPPSRALPSTQRSRARRSTRASGSLEAWSSRPACWCSRGPSLFPWPLPDARSSACAATASPTRAPRAGWNATAPTREADPRRAELGRGPSAASRTERRSCARRRAAASALPRARSACGRAGASRGRGGVAIPWAQGGTMNAVGIDLGTAFARVAVAGRGRPTLAVDAAGASTLPAVVALRGRGRPRLGAAAFAGPISPTRTVRGVKRWLGCAWGDAPLREAEAEGLRWKRGPQNVPRLDLGVGRDASSERAAQVLSPSATEVATLVFERLRAMAEEEGKIEVCAASAPAWFGSSARDALRAAATAAGLDVRTFVPDAVALAAGVAQRAQRVVAVIDVGAGGASVALLESGPEHVRLLASAGCDACGGEAVDSALIERSLSGLAERGIALPRDAAFGAILRLACERMRRTLVSEPSAAYALVGLDGVQDTPVISLEQSDLQRALTPSAELLERCARAALAEARVDRQRVEAVYLAGGMSAHRTLVAGALAALGGTVSMRPEGSLALGLARIAQGLAGLAAPIAVEVRAWGTRVEAPRPKPAADTGVRSAAPAQARPSQSPARTREPPPPGPARAGASTPAATSASSAGPAQQAARPGPPTVALERGRFVSPADPAAYLQVPLFRPLTEADLDPIALPALLRRVLARGSLTGTAFVEHAGGTAEIAVVGGRAYLSQRERAALRRACFAREGRWWFDASAAPSEQGRMRSTMIRLVVDGLRTIARDWTTDAVARALGPRLELSPVVPEHGLPDLDLLGLLPPEARMIEFGFDGRQSAGEILEQAASDVAVSPRLMILLESLGLLTWRPVAARKKLTLAEELALEAETPRNAFEVLGLHWSATGEEAAAAYIAVSKQLEPGGRWDRAAPTACETLRARAAQARAALVDDRRRLELRRTEYPNLDIDAVSDFLEKKLKALELRGDEREMAVERAALREMSRSGRIVPRRPPEEE